MSCLRAYPGTVGVFTQHTTHAITPTTHTLHNTLHNTLCATKHKAPNLPQAAHHTLHKTQHMISQHNTKRHKHQANHSTIPQNASNTTQSTHLIHEGIDPWPDAGRAQRDPAISDTSSLSSHGPLSIDTGYMVSQRDGARKESTFQKRIPEHGCSHELVARAAANPLLFPQVVLRYHY